MAEVNEIYRIYVGEDGHHWKDVDITAANGDVVDFSIRDVVDIDGVAVGDKETAVDLSTVTYDRLCDKDGACAYSVTEEAPEE